MNYAELLKDPRWQKKRLEIFDRDKYSCKKCKSTTKSLHAHHIYYERGLKPWEYDNECIITLCEDCHNEIHGKINKISSLISFYAVVFGLDFLTIEKKLKEALNEK